MCVCAPAGAHGVQYVCTRMLLSSRVYTVLCWNGEHVSPSASPWERTSFVLASFVWFIIAPEMNKGEGMCVYMYVCWYVGCTCGGMQRSASSGVFESGLLTGLFGKPGWPASTGNSVSISQVLR